MHQRQLKQAVTRRRQGEKAGTSRLAARLVTTRETKRGCVATRITRTARFPMRNSSPKQKINHLRSFPSPITDGCLLSTRQSRAPRRGQNDRDPGQWAFVCVQPGYPRALVPLSHVQKRGWCSHIIFSSLHGRAYEAHDRSRALAHERHIRSTRAS